MRALALVLAWGAWMSWASWASAAADDRPSMTVGGISGVTTWRPEGWGQFNATVSNRGDADEVWTVAVSFDDLPNVQYGVKVWVPAGASRTIRVPARAPDFKLKKDQQGVGATSLLLDRRETRLATQVSLVLPSRDEWVTASMTGTDEAGESCMTAASAMRVSRSLTHRVLAIGPSGAPSEPLCWSGADVVVLALPELNLSAAQKEALRRWLVGGGRLWVMLDRLPSGSMEELLGGDWTVSELDRVGLNTGRIDGPEGQPVVWDQEEPVRMVRVLAGGDWEVSHRVDGRPAAMRRSVGRGRVLATTVEARAWYVERPGKTPGGEATPALASLGAELYDGRPGRAAGPGWADRSGDDSGVSAMGSLVWSQIGYPIAPRWWIASVLLASVLAVAVGAVVLGRRGRLEWLGAVAAVACLASAAAMLVIGMAARDVAPLSVASAQVVRVASQQRLAESTGVVSFYSPDTEPGPVIGEAGGVVWPRFQDLQGKTLRLTWRDIDRWSWLNLSVPSGATRTAEFGRTAALDSEFRAEIELAADSLKGRIVGGAARGLEDMVLWLPGGGSTGVPALRVTGREGTDLLVESGPGDRLPTGKFIAAQVGLSDAQQRRQEAYRQLLTGRTAGRALGATGDPSGYVLGWTSRASDLSPGVDLSRPASRRDAMLVALPIRLRVGGPGQPVTIPSAFLPLSVERDGQRANLATVYEPNTREWLSLAMGGAVVVRFTPPREALPMRVTGGRLTLDISAPGRSVEVLRLRGDRLETLARASDPSGPILAELPGDLDPAADGSVRLYLRVGEAPDRGEPPLWQVRSVSLELRGVRR